MVERKGLTMNKNNYIVMDVTSDFRDEEAYIGTFLCPVSTSQEFYTTVQAAVKRHSVLSQQRTDLSLYDVLVDRLELIGAFPVKHYTIEVNTEGVKPAESTNRRKFGIGTSA